MEKEEIERIIAQKIHKLGGAKKILEKYYDISYGNYNVEELKKALYVIREKNYGKRRNKKNCSSKNS